MYSVTGVSYSSSAGDEAVQVTVTSLEPPLRRVTPVGGAGTSVEEQVNCRLEYGQSYVL